MTKAEHRKMSQIVRKIKRGIQAVREERAEKIQGESRLTKVPGSGTERHFNSGHDSHAQKRLAYPWTKHRSTYAHLLNNPTCQPGDTEEARRMVCRILSLIDRGEWSKAENTRLHRMLRKWQSRTEGKDFRFMFVGNRPGRPPRHLAAKIKFMEVYQHEKQGIRSR